MPAKNRIYRKSRRSRERGQAAVFLVLALGVFLIGGVGFVVDGANLWFHRQSAQTAADAACNAGAMDLLSVAAGVDLPNSDWIGGGGGNGPFLCSDTSGPSKTPNSGLPPCWYAGNNGYSGSKMKAVQVTLFQAHALSIVPQCGTPSTAVCPADDFAATPYIRVDVKDNVPTTFMQLLGAGPTSSVPARATCGLSNVLSPVPIVVLNPNAPHGVDANGVNMTSTFQGSGTLSAAYTISAPKNPTKLVQVNSSDTDAVTNLSATINLSNADGSTGDFAIAGSSKPTADGSYTAVNGAGVTSDPFATIRIDKAALKAQAQALGTNPVTYGTKGCPNAGNPCCPGIPSSVFCDDYRPGYYPPLSSLGIPCTASLGGNAAICVGSSGGVYPSGSTGLAVFEPGLYYLEEDFFAGPGSCLRSATRSIDGGGSMFYLSGQAVLNVTGASGTLTSGSFNCSSTPVSLTDATCPGGNLNVPPSVTGFTGNVLLAPCTGTYGDPSGNGQVRGMLFFQERDVQPLNQPTLNGSGSFALVGNIYLHYCNSTSSLGTDSGANCAPDAFTETLTLGGGPNAYVVGGIVVDQLEIESGADIHVVLNPKPQYYVLKASLLQ